MKHFGEGRFALLFLQILSVWQNWFDFKPDTIINHQLELSGTRAKYLDHEKRAYTHEIWSYRISEKASNNRSFWRVQSEVVWSLLQLAYIVYARSESPGEVMRKCRLVRTFATRRCNNHHFVC